MHDLEPLAQVLGEGGGIKTGPFGTLLKASEYSADGVPMLSVREIRAGRIRVDEETPRLGAEVTKRLPEFLLEAGDVLVARKGGVDRSVYIGAAECGWFMGSDALRVRPGSGLVGRFLALQMQTPRARAWLAAHATGSTMPSLNQAILGRLPVWMPCPAVQQAIAEVLGVLDDKIAANASLVATLNALTETLYRVSVDCSQRLTDLASFVNGRNFTKDATGDGRVVIRIAELNSGVGSSTVRNQVEAPDVHVARLGDILFAWSGSLTLHRWTMSEALVNQHIFKVIPTSGVPSWLVYHALAHQMPAFKAIAADKATTMGHIQRKHLDVDVPTPSRTSWAALDTKIAPLWDRSLSAAVESRTLAQLRDTLLPALMDGRLRVKDAIAQAEEVL